MFNAALASACHMWLHFLHTALCRAIRLIGCPHTAHLEEVPLGSIGLTFIPKRVQEASMRFLNIRKVQKLCTKRFFAPKSISSRIPVKSSRKSVVTWCCFKMRAIFEDKETSACLSLRAQS